MNYVICILVLKGYILTGDIDYVKDNFNVRIDLKNLDLYTIAGINCIVRNLSFLPSLVVNEK